MSRGVSRTIPALATLTALVATATAATGVKRRRKQRRRNQMDKILTEATEKGSVMRGRRWRLLAPVGLVALIAAIALTQVSAAFNSNTRDGLSAYVDVDARGQVPAGSVVRHFVHVINSNDLGPGDVRATIANAFVLDSIDLTTFFNGVQVGGAFTVDAPPNSTAFTGRWPTTVTGNINAGFQVGKPAIIPGENTVAFYVGQPLDLGSGKYVFAYTLHGTLNGNPVDLSATGPQIIAVG